MQKNSLISGTHRTLWTFFALVFVLSAPFWLVGPLADRLVSEARPVNLPASALMVVCPAIAALILVSREQGWEGAKRLLQSAFDLKRIKRKLWLLPVLFLTPAVMVLQHGLANPARAVVAGPPSPAWMALLLFLVFVVAALGEELGWQGYAVERLLHRWNALTVSIILGTVWAVWHIVPFIQLNTSPAEIVWHGLNMVVMRIVIVWLYVNTGRSILSAVLYHAMYNVSTLVLPGYGLRYDPVVVCMVTAGIAVLVTFLWGHETLARYRFARANKQG